MNRYCIILFLVISFSTVNELLAQVPEWSVRGGLNLATSGGRDAVGSKFILGTHLGFFGTLPFTSDYSLESGLSYSLKGSRSVSNIGRNQYKLHYLELPVLARLNIYEGLDILAGPQISFLMASKIRIEPNLGGQLIEQNTTDGLRRLDLGLHLGTAYDLSDQVSVGLGLDWGLLTQGKEGNDKTFNRIIKITASYQLD